MKRASFAFVLLALAACAAKTGGPVEPIVINPGSTLGFTPSQVTASRSADACNNPNPPYDISRDGFTLGAIGRQAQGPLTAISLAFESTSNPVQVGQGFDLALDAPISAQNPGGDYRVQNATSPGNVLSFQFQWGAATPAEIDGNPLDAVHVDIDAFPSHDGEPMTVRFVLHFTDGQTLDATFSGNTISYLGGCTAG
jgi:hypothetical protein